LSGLLTGLSPFVPGSVCPKAGKLAFACMHSLHRIGSFLPMVTRTSRSYLARPDKPDSDKTPRTAVVCKPVCTWVGNIGLGYAGLRETNRGSRSSQSQVVIISRAYLLPLSFKPGQARWPMARRKQQIITLPPAVVIVADDAFVHCLQSPGSAE
jgi:hypothetical protein